MRVNENGRTFTMADGSTHSTSAFHSQIEHVTLPWDGCVRGTLAQADAVVLSLLVVPDGALGVYADALRERRRNDADALLAEVLRYGDIAFQYQHETVFQAPVLALMQRYHGLTEATALLNRFRMVINPNVASEDLVAGLVPVVGVPWMVRHGLEFSLVHNPHGGGKTEPRGFTVELQYWINRSHSKLFDYERVL